MISLEAVNICLGPVGTNPITDFKLKKKGHLLEADWANSTDRKIGSPERLPDCKTLVTTVFTKTSRFGRVARAGAI